MKRVPREERRRRAREALALVRLEDLGARKPAQLSGGQRQRIALARAIVNRPQALLLDEPLGALDLKLRQELQIELKQIQQELRMTFIYVTHDQEEALTMSDRIAVFNEGRIEQIGTPAEMYEHPGTAFVAGFIGTSNVIERDGRRFTVRPEKIRLLAQDAAEGEGRNGPGGRLPGSDHPVRRRARRRRRTVGGAAEPRDVVERRPRDGGQACPARMATGRGVRHQGGNVKRTRFLQVAFAVGVVALVVALVVPAVGVSKSGALPTSVGPGEGKLTLIAWEGYTDKSWVGAVREADGMQRFGEVRRHLE